MTILVCMKQVPFSASIGMNTSTKTVIRDGVPLITNPSDENALEAALEVKDLFGGTVSVITMGPKSSVQMLKETASLGADRLFLINDRVFAGSDTLATSMILQSAVQYIEDFDLIICGRRAIDGETGQVGPELAALLNIPCVTNVSGLQYDKQGALTCRRLVDEGTELIEIHLPALITVSEGLNKLRLPSLASLKKAKNINIEILTNQELSVDPHSVGSKGSPTSIKTLRPVKKSIRRCVPETDLTIGVKMVRSQLMEKLRLGDKLG